MSVRSIKVGKGRYNLSISRNTYAYHLQSVSEYLYLVSYAQEQPLVEMCTCNWTEVEELEALTEQREPYAEWH